MRVFLAGPGTQRSFLGQLIREKLPAMGYESYDWTSGPGWDNPQAFIPVEVARRDIEEIRRSDFVVRFVDGEHISDGAAFEAGFCIARGIPLVTWLCKSLQGKPPHNYIYSHLTLDDADHQVANSLEEALRLGVEAVSREIIQTQTAGIQEQSKLLESQNSASRKRNASTDG